ncbi:cecropin-like [Battus philenor]|uniref:cecropin-like n=1 Tax=Battus philenor TaxID=42288 RepID=UPI0035D0FDB9
MNFVKILVFVMACFAAVSVTSANPRWKIFKKIEKAGQNIRDAIISAGPAVDVLAKAQRVINGEPEEDE